MTIPAILDRIQKRVLTSVRFDPTRDWLVLVSLALMALAGIIVWNAWAFDTVANGGVIGASSTTPVAAFDQHSLTTVDTVFIHRASEETKYLTGEYRFADPSQ